MICEVCVDSLAGAKAAIGGGADRLELCGDLLTGGITPSPGLIDIVLRTSTIPVMVMVRPRGGDFCYDTGEIQVMSRDIEAARRAGAHGVVLGALLPDGSVDVAALRELRACAQGMSVTFHRAFDVCRDPHQACEVLIAHRVDRLLTSGQQGTAVEGVALLQEIQHRYGASLTIMPGGGINAQNVARLLCDTRVREVHFSGSTLVASPMSFSRPGVAMASGAGGETTPARPQTSESRVAQIVAAVRAAVA
jgi:copper homeostasis protein